MMIDLAKELGIEVIGEGVETEVAYHFLKKNGCDNMQGFYFSRPLPSKQIERYLLSIV